MPEIKVIEVIEPPVSVKLTNGVKGDQGKSIVSASFVGNDIVFVNDENEEIVIEGGKTALQGSSAYQVWVEQGNEGTVEDYLASLIGPQGNPGYTPIKGTDYFDGDDGLSAYQVWLAAGNVGTEAQFLAKLKGNQWKGAYVPGTPYVVDDVVSYNGSSYICILDSLGNLPSNTNYWSLFAQAGEVTTAAMNTALANKADKLFATNLVTNGDFSNGVTNWTGADCTISNVANTLIAVVSNNSTNTVVRYGAGLITPIVGNIYYVSAKIKAFRTHFPLLSAFGAYPTSAKSAVAGVDTQLSWRFVAVSNSSIFAIYLNGGLSTDQVIGSQVTFDDVLAVNLTSLFGSGKEPTAQQMDWLLAQKYANSWFDGTKELTSITDLLTLVNTKADKTQETLISPTLLSGWTGILKYRKNTVGDLEIYGELVAGTVVSGTQIAVFPVGYRPPINSPIIAYNTSNGATIVLNLYYANGTFYYTAGSITAGHTIKFNAVMVVGG